MHPSARHTCRPCWARIHDHGGDLLILVAAWGCQAAIWYSCVSPPRISLSRCELAVGPVRPGCVVVAQVLGQYPVQRVLIDDQQPVEELPTQGTDDPFADGVLLWAPAVAAVLDISDATPTVIRRRCQASSVPGVTSRWARNTAGSSRASAARTARSAQSGFARAI